MEISNVLENRSARIRRLAGLKLCLVLSALALIAQLFGPDALRWWQERPRAGQQTPGSVLVADSHGRQYLLRYLVYLPENYSSADLYPLVLFLHGSGERGDNLDLLRNVGPHNFVSKGHGLPLIVVSPQCPGGTRWETTSLLDLLKCLHEKFSIDPSRIYVSGYSMGGFGTWELVAAAPNKFAAAVPVAGGGDVNNAERVRDIPIWSFHGAHDRVIPLDSSRKMVDAIHAAGGKSVRLTVLENEGHGICDSIFARDDLYQWLLQQRRTQTN